MDKDRANFGRRVLAVVVAAASVTALGKFGQWLWLTGSALVLGSPGDILV